MAIHESIRLDLQAQRSYREDTDRIKAHTATTLTTLLDFSRTHVGNDVVSIQSRSNLDTAPLTGTCIPRPLAEVTPLPVQDLAGRRFIARGAAWAGEKRVRQVEFSTDGGNSWAPARLDSEPLPYAWVLWSYDWKIAGAGSYDLAVRATNDAGQAQPAERETDRMDAYELNAWQAIHIR